MNNLVEILAQAEYVLPGYRPQKPLREVLLNLAHALDEDANADMYGDVYGTGDSLADFEREVAALLGKEAAVFMPSGTMAQQIALRIWCERRRHFTVAMHPTAHLETAEHHAYQFLHGIQRIPFGAPEFLRDRMLRVSDFERLGQEPAVVLLELPYRPLGSPLPDWDDLVAIRDWASERGIRLHMDGARLWQCRPFYGKSYAEIASLFDSVYVSFYKDLGGLCGSMLAGPAAFIEEARVWQVRHGGRLRTQGPFWVSGKVGLERVLPQIDSWVEKARDVAAALTTFDRIKVYPDPPHVNMFQLYIRGDADRLNELHLEVAKETGRFLFFHLHPSPVPGIATTEMILWENSLAFPTDELPGLLDQLLA